MRDRVVRSRPTVKIFGAVVAVGVLVLVLANVLFHLNPFTWAADHAGIVPTRFESSFETGEIQCRVCAVDAWSMENLSNNSEAIEVVGRQSGAPVRDGEYSVRIHADYDDDWDPKPKVELSAYWQPFFLERTEYWVGWSIYLPDDGTYEFDSAYQEVLLQIHALNDDCDGNGMGPTHALRPLDGRWRWDVRWDSTRCLDGDPAGQEIIDIGAQERGRWTDFVARFVFSHEDDGITQVWRDGELVVDRIGMPNHYNDEHGPFMKMGFYKSGWLENETDVATRTLFLDTIAVYEGVDGFSKVDPAR